MYYYYHRYSSISGQNYNLSDRRTDVVQGVRDIPLLRLVVPSLHPAAAAHDRQDEENRCETNLGKLCHGYLQRQILVGSICKHSNFLS